MPTQLPEQELADIFQFALKIAEYGGSKIKEGYYTRFSSDSVRSKSNPRDLVTQYDQEIEQHAIEMIREKFPSHRIIGEESDASGEKWILSDEPTWIIDPIDGTTNFVHRFPYVCISVAVFIDRSPHIGVVFNPITNELFTAQLGKGSYLNLATRLPIFNPTPHDSVNSPSRSIILSEVDSIRQESAIAAKCQTLHNFETEGRCPGIRVVGSSALNLCLLAQGCVEVYWDIGPHIWDFAAAILILREAGGFAISEIDRGQDLTLESAREFNFNGRKALAIRNLLGMPKDRARTREESEMADRYSLHVLQTFIPHIRYVPAEEDGA